MSTEYTLFKAIEQDNVELVRQLLKKDSNLINGYNIVYLFNAIKKSEMISIFFTICGQKMIDYFKMHNELILFSAITNKKELEIIKEILKFDKNIVNFESKSGDTPLMHAIQKDGDLNLIELLILSNANVNKCNSRHQSPLHIAEKLEVIKILIKNGADINCCDRRGLTPLLRAVVYRRDKEILFELIKSGANLNACDDRGRTPLHLALYAKYDDDIVWEIFSKTINVNAEDDGGLTPLCYALDERTCRVHTYYTKDFISELIRKGAALNTNALMHSIQYSKNLEIIKEFINNFEVNVKSVDSNGNGVLHYASDVKIINILVRNGASVNHENNNGVTPLMEAVRCKKDVKIIKSLLLFGADVSCMDFYFNENNIFLLDDEILNTLVLYGVRISSENKYVKSILGIILHKIIDVPSFSFENHNYCVLRHILLSNADIKIPNDYLLCDRMNKFLQIYYSELNKLKEISILDNISFYDFCTKYYKSIRCFINIPECEFAKNKYEKIKLLFPIFFDIIILKIRINDKIQNRWKLKKKLLNVSIQCLCEPHACDSEYDSESFNITQRSSDIIDFVELHSDCLYYMSRYLNDRELSCLLLAATLA